MRPLAVGVCNVHLQIGERGVNAANAEVWSVREGGFNRFTEYMSTQPGEDRLQRVTNQVVTTRTVPRGRES